MNQLFINGVGGLPPVTDAVAIAIIWMAAPFFIGFSGYLLPRWTPHLGLGIALSSGVYGLLHTFDVQPLPVELLDSFGVTLQIDTLSGYFILTNALVTAAVVLYCWTTGKSAFFYTQLIILHGSLNAVFICADFISLYVALEVIGIASFLLIAYPRSDRSIWVALRYLLVSNTAMLFYLIGAVLVYQANHSFAFTGLSQAPTEAIALIVLGLLTKGGVFISGLWLPLTHSEADTPVSAILSGAVVKAGVFPLVRCAALVDELGILLSLFSVGTAVLGVCYAIWERDTKRLLASSTVSQVGFILAAPSAAGIYALGHGVAKAALFLIAGNLPSRDLGQLRQMAIGWPLRLALTIASLSIVGVPLLVGFGAKALAVKDLASWQGIALNICAVGTAIAFAKLIGWPPEKEPKPMPLPTNPGLWWALILLLGSLVAANGFHLEVYTGANMVKALGIAAAGWLIYAMVIRRLTLTLPRMLERLDHLIGMMTVMLTALFWMVFA
jgi:multicomponent Na+:H+ antiporter subunit D